MQEVWVGLAKVYLSVLQQKITYQIQQKARIQTEAHHSSSGLRRQQEQHISHAFKATTDILTTSWGSLDSKLQQQLEQLGIKPQAPNPEPDLTDVLKENLSQLPTAVSELVEKITKPPPETERDMAMKLLKSPL